jgi:hypothetical protein
MWSSSIKMSLTFKNDFDDVQNVMPNTAVVMMRLVFRNFGLVNYDPELLTELGGSSA